MGNSKSEMLPTDAVLIEKISKGDANAFHCLFDSHYSNLCRYAFHFIGDADMAQSLVQNVFVRLWENRYKIKKIKNLGAYLTTMVRNQCADYLRELQIFYPDSKNHINDQSTNSTEETILGNDFEERLIHALAKLPARCREAFELSRFENRSNKEIANEMKISIKGVEALISRSLKILRFELREFLPSFDSKNSIPVLLYLKISKLFFVH